MAISIHIKLLRYLAFLLLSISCFSPTHTKIEKTKLLYLRHALMGKTTDPTRVATLLAVTGLAATQIYLIYSLIKACHENKPYIKDPELSKKIYTLCKFPPKQPEKSKDYDLKCITAALLVLYGYVSLGIIFPLCYARSKEIRPTSDFSWLKYPFLFGTNGLGVLLYMICQNLFFDYNTNLIQLLKHYNPKLIPTVFKPTFDALAQNYKEHKTCSLTKEEQHYFVLGILKQIQEELLEPVTILSFPINSKIKEILQKLPVVKA